MRPKSPWAPRPPVWVAVIMGDTTPTRKPELSMKGSEDDAGVYSSPPVAALAGESKAGATPGSPGSPVVPLSLAAAARGSRTFVEEDGDVRGDDIRVSGTREARLAARGRIASLAWRSGAALCLQAPPA